MDDICAECPNLKKFEYKDSWSTLFKNIFTEHPPKSDCKFLHLTNIGFLFYGRAFPEEDVKAWYLKDYLLDKCPRIDEILIEKEVYARYWNHETHKWEAETENVTLRSENNDRFRIVPKTYLEELQLQEWLSKF